MRVLPRIEGYLLFVWIIQLVTGDDLITVPPVDTEADQGSNVNFSCRVAVPDHLNADNLHVKWKHNGHYIKPHTRSHNRSEKYLEEEKGQTLMIKKVEGKDAGVYTCIVHIGINRDLANAKLAVREPPEAPQEVAVVSCTGNEVKLIWKPGRDGGAEINHYLVQFNTSQNPTNWNYYHEEIAGNLQTTIINLSPWGTYNFRVLSRNSVGYSKPSQPTKIDCTTPPERPGGNPKDVRTLTHKMGKLIVTWTPMPQLQYNGPGFKYIIFWRRKGSTYWNKNIVENTSSNMWEVTVNDTFKRYEIKVKASNQIGDSRAPAFIFHGFSGEGEPTVIPKDFRIDPTKPIVAHRAHFIWEAVDTTVEKIKGEFRGYKLRYWKSSEGRHHWNEVDILITKEDHGRPDVRAAIDDLPAHTALRAQVTVMNTHYTGPPSQTIDFTTPEGVPGAVRDLRIDEYGSTFALLKWLPPEEPNGRLLGYDIGYQQITGDVKGSIKALRPQINNPDTLGAKITGLTASHKYRFYVWARTGIGRGEPIFQDVKTQDGPPPDTPRPKITTHHTSVNITLSPYRLVDVTYEIQYRRSGRDRWMVANPEWGRNWMVINNLLPDREYEVRLIAKNKYGDTASSTLYHVSTSSQPRQGGDAHQYQRGDEAYRPTSTGSSFIHQDVNFSFLCARTRTLLLQTIVTLLIIFTIFH